MQASPDPMLILEIAGGIILAVIVVRALPAVLGAAYRAVVSLAAAGGVLVTVYMIYSHWQESRGKRRRVFLPLKLSRALKFGKSGKASDRGIWCREWESNPHGVATAGF